jgi:hypothetical protein
MFDTADTHCDNKESLNRVFFNKYNRIIAIEVKNERNSFCILSEFM